MAILIIGAGGHAKVVADILQESGDVVLGFLSDHEADWSTRVMGYPVLGAVRQWQDFAPDGLVLAIGSNAVRQKLVDALSDDAAPLWVNAVHPSVVIARSAQLGVGVMVVAGAVINPEARIGNHVIVNTGASIDHDCVIGDYVHIAPGTHLAGAVAVDEGTFVGIGTSVIPGIHIGAWSVIGAGAVVVRDVPERSQAVGVPARVKTLKR